MNNFIHEIQLKQYYIEDEEKKRNKKFDQPVLIKLILVLLGEFCYSEVDLRPAVFM